MSISKKKFMISISFGLNIIFVVCLYLLYQENTEMKKGVIRQYSLQQNEVLLNLETAIRHQDDKVDYVNSLVGAYANTNHNFYLTSEYYSAANYVNIPKNISILNSPTVSGIIVQSLDNRITAKSDKDVEQELKTYISQVSQVVDTLDFVNNINGKSLKEQYKTLDEVSDLIEGFNLGK